MIETVHSPDTRTAHPSTWEVNDFEGEFQASASELPRNRAEMRSSSVESTVATFDGVNVSLDFFAVSEGLCSVDIPIGVINVLVQAHLRRQQAVQTGL